MKSCVVGVAIGIAAAMLAPSSPASAMAAQQPSNRATATEPRAAAVAKAPRATQSRSTGAPKYVSQAAATPLSTRRAKLRWSKTAGASSYVIRVATDKIQRTGVRRFTAKGTHAVIALPATNPGVTYWYRVFGRHNGKLSRTSKLRALNLRVGPVRSLRTYAGPHEGLSLRWLPGVNAQQHRILVATNPQFSGARVYITRSPVGTFAAPHLAAGVTYYFRVQARNPVSSSPAVSTKATMASNLASLTVGTYNVHRGSSDLPNTGARLDLVGNELRRGDFDAVGVQECNTSMLHSIRSRVGSIYNYSRAVGKTGYNTTGGQILYRSARLEALDHQAVIDLPTPGGKFDRHALYQEFRQVSTGARFIFVSAHLYSGDGRARSDLRRREVETMLNGIMRANTEGLPVVFGGDMNSNKGRKYVYDAAQQLFASHGIADAFQTATRLRNANFNSSNGLSSRPPKGGYYVDRVFATGNVPVLSGEVMVRLSGRYNARPFASDHNAIRVQVQIPY